jgi:ribosome-associated protein
MILIPDNEFHFSFSRSSGAGGQNVNKLNTKVTLTWDIESSQSLNGSIKKRFLITYKNLLTDHGVVLQSDRYRSQKRNKDDAIEKLHSLIETVRKPPKMRVPTKPTLAARKRRLLQKKRHSDKKKMRQEKY